MGPFCVVCQKDFGNQSNLEMHLHLKHGIRRDWQKSDPFNSLYDSPLSQMYSHPLDHHKKSDSFAVNTSMSSQEALVSSPSDLSAASGPSPIPHGTDAYTSVEIGRYGAGMGLGSHNNFSFDRHESSNSRSDAPADEHRHIPRQSKITIISKGSSVAFSPPNSSGLVKSSTPKSSSDNNDEEIVSIDLKEGQSIMPMSSMSSSSMKDLSQEHVCRYCQKSFLKLGNLKIHMRNKHDRSLESVNNKSDIKEQTSAFKMIYENNQSSSSLAVCKTSGSNSRLDLKASRESLLLTNLDSAPRPTCMRNMLPVHKASGFADNFLLKPISCCDQTTNDSPDIIEVPKSPVEKAKISPYLKEIKLRGNVFRKRPAPPALKPDSGRRKSVIECDDVVPLYESRPSRSNSQIFSNESYFSNKLNRTNSELAIPKKFNFSSTTTHESNSGSKFTQLSKEVRNRNPNQTKYCQLCKKNMENFYDLQEHVVTFHRVPFTTYIENLSIQIPEQTAVEQSRNLSRSSSVLLSEEKSPDRVEDWSSKMTKDSRVGSPIDGTIHQDFVLSQINTELKDSRLKYIYSKLLAPCVVSLPVKSKISKSFVMKIKLKPLDSLNGKTDEKSHKKLQKLRSRDDKKFKKYIMDLIQSKNYAQVTEVINKKALLESQTPKTISPRGTKPRYSSNDNQDESSMSAKPPTYGSKLFTESAYSNQTNLKRSFKHDYSLDDENENNEEEAEINDDEREDFGLAASKRMKTSASRITDEDNGVLKSLQTYLKEEKFQC